MTGGGGTHSSLDKYSLLEELSYLYTDINVPGSYISYDKFREHKPPRVINPREYNVLQLPTKELNKFINKNPFVIRDTEKGPIKATSNHVFPKMETNYDIIIYKDRIVYISGGKLGDTVDYKSFKIPELTILESGKDTKLNAYKKLKLNRKDIIGPNIFTRILPDDGTLRSPINIQYGFRIYGGYLYDIFMDSVRVAEKSFLRYDRRYIDGRWVLLYF